MLSRFQPVQAGQGLYRDSENLAHSPTRPILSRDDRAVAYKDTGASPRRRSAAFCWGPVGWDCHGWGLVGGRPARHAWGNTAGVFYSRGQRRRDSGLRRPRLCPAGRTDEVGTHPPCTPRSPAAGREREPPGTARATARPAESCQAGALRRPPGWPRPAGPSPGRRPPTSRLASAPWKGRAGRLAPAAPAEGLGYLGGCWWLGSFPDGRGTSGRGSGGRTRREGGRNPSAEALAGRRAGRRLQTLGWQSRWRRRLLLRLPQDLPRAGPRWRRSLHRVSCHPRNGPDHKRRGEDARAASGARKRVVETNLTATPLRQFAPPE